MHNYITLAGYKLDMFFINKPILLIKTLIIPASTKPNARKIDHIPILRAFYIADSLAGSNPAVALKRFFHLGIQRFGKHIGSFYGKVHGIGLIAGLQIFQ